MTDSRSQMEESKTQAVPYQVFDLPHIPLQVDLADLQSNGKFLTNEEILSVKTLLKNLPDGRYHKADVKQKFGIIKSNHCYYAVYKGEKYHKELGVGSFAKVKLVQSLEDGSWFKLKIQKGRFELLRWEHRFLTMLKVVKDSIFIRGTKQHLLVPYAKGQDLWNVLTVFPEMTPLRVLDILIQCFQKIKMINQLGFIHGDIKVDNFIYDYVNNSIDVIDFGLAKEKDNNGCAILRDLEDKIVSKSLQGTSLYLAPECISSSIYNNQSEIYALGILAMIMMGFEVKLKANHLWKSETFSSGHVQDFFKQNGTLLQFLNKLTQKNPDMRGDFDEAIQFFNEVKAELIPIYISSVGVIDIHEYHDCYSYMRNNYIKALRCVNEVCLVNNGPVASEKLFAVIKDLEKRNVFLKNKYYIFNAQTLASFPEIFAQNDVNSDNKIYDYFYFSPYLDNQDNMKQALRCNGVTAIAINNYQTDRVLKNAISSSRNCINTKNIAIVVTALEDEIKRLNTKFKLLDDKVSRTPASNIAAKRSSLILAVLDNLKLLQSKGKLTHGVVFRKIEFLQRQIMATKPSALSEMNFFLKKGATEKALDKLKGEMSVVVSQLR